MSTRRDEGKKHGACDREKAIGEGAERATEKKCVGVSSEDDNGDRSRRVVECEGRAAWLNGERKRAILRGGGRARSVGIGNGAENERNGCFYNEKEKRERGSEKEEWVFLRKCGKKRFF